MDKIKKKKEMKMMREGSETSLSYEEWEEKGGGLRSFDRWQSLLELPTIYLWHLAANAKAGLLRKITCNRQYFIYTHHVKKTTISFLFMYFFLMWRNIGMFANLWQSNRTVIEFMRRVGSLYNDHVIKARKSPI